MGGQGKYNSSYPGLVGDLTSHSDVNVAYDGTAADLDATMMNDWSWGELSSSTDSLPNFTAVNNDNFGMRNDGTVSPQDILVSSVPPSTAFTNLTTPGSAFLDTPDDNYEASPLFNDSLTSGLGNEPDWFTLFPDADDKPTATAPAMSRTTSSHSQIVMVHPGGESRRRPSANVSPITASIRPSSVAGINKRDKALPPIIADESDPVALKRARNTAAARKSRDKKVREREGYEARIVELQNEVERWKALALASHPQLGDAE